MCLYPKLITNRKYTETKKNKGIIPVAEDARVLLVPVGCGKCMECKGKKSREWQVRLQEEIRNNREGQFVTLTFSTESLLELNKELEIGINGYERDNEIAKIGVRRFLERWRKKYKKSVKHWLITELGGGRYEHMHIHGIIWTKEKEDIKQIWKYGFVYIGNEVSNRTANYITKYITKSDEKHKEYNAKILTSAGIGKGYMDRTDIRVNKYKEEGKTEETYRTEKGNKIALPIYYRNKIYTEEEREKLWIEKLDKQVRYVLGIKIDISKDDKHYYGALANARAKNKRLGYGDDEINWERRNYENQRRNLKFKERQEKDKA